MKHAPWMCAICLLMTAIAAAEAPTKAGNPDAEKSKVPAAKKSKDKSIPKVQDEAAEMEAIRRSSEEFINAFNQHDAKSLAEMWTADGDYVNESGQVFAGREAIEEEYRKFFAVNDDVKMHVAIDSTRLLNDSAAIEHGRTYLFPAPAGAPGYGRYTTVHVKQNGKWLMSSVRDGHVQTPTAYHKIADLEWLIGTWNAEEHGAKMVSVCRWVANKSFVERTYSVTHHDHSTVSGVQLIGFNSQGRHIQSWNFSSDGGHAVGVWTPREGGWRAEVHGITGEGASTFAVNLLTRIDDNAYSWQSVQRTAGGARLPDTDEVIIKRQTPTP